MDSLREAADRLAESERVSLRALVVPDGEDPVPYLLKAGIIDPIKLSYTAAADGGTAGSMGDGNTPGVAATLVFDDTEGQPGPGQPGSGADGDQPDRDAAADQAAGLAAQAREQELDRDKDAQVAEPYRSGNLPDAFGLRTTAPVWRPR